MIVRGDNNNEVLLVSSMSGGATEVYMGSVRVGPK